MLKIELIYFVSCLCLAFLPNDCLFIFIFNRALSSAEILEILEKSDSEQHSDTEENPGKRVVNVLISPLENGNGTDEDSGDEEEVCLSNLPGKQLRSNATKSRERLEDCEIPDKRSSNFRKKKNKHETGKMLI